MVSEKLLKPHLDLSLKNQQTYDTLLHFHTDIEKFVNNISQNPLPKKSQKYPAFNQMFLIQTPFQKLHK